MPELGFPSAHHDEIIELEVEDLRRVVETTLAELGWNSAENWDEEYTQFFRPDDTWWKNRWKSGKVKMLGSDRVSVHIEKFALGDIVDWTDECKKLVDTFRTRLLEVARRGTDAPYRG